MPQYGAVALGVLVDPLIRGYIDTETFNFDFWGLLARAGFALLMAILLFAGGLQERIRPGKAHPGSALRGVYFGGWLAVSVPDRGDGGGQLNG